MMNLNDVTFLIRTRLDSISRLENLILVVEFISNNFDTQIHVHESAKYDNQLLKKLLPQGVIIKYEEDFDPIYHYTKYMNRMVQTCETSFLAVWEADVIVSPEQILKSIDMLRNQEADFVSPYKDKALDTTLVVRELYFKTRDFSVLQENCDKMIELYAPNPVGGGFFAQKESYIEAGMENEKFYGWGREDGERINRWKKLGYRYERINGPLFHLTHERGVNSRFHSPTQDNIKSSEVFRLYGMSRQEMIQEIKTW